MLRYLELAHLILSVYSLFQPSQDFNQMASDAKLPWRADISRSKDTIIEKFSRLWSVSFHYNHVNFKDTSLILAN